MPKNEPFPRLDAAVEELFGNTRSFTWNSDGEVWAIMAHEGFQPGKLELVVKCKDWETAYTVSELLNKFRRVNDKVEHTWIANVIAEAEKRRGL
jgi:hypothetical protein